MDDNYPLQDRSKTLYTQNLTIQSGRKKAGDRLRQVLLYNAYLATGVVPITDMIKANAKFTEQPERVQICMKQPKFFVLHSKFNVKYVQDF